MTQNSNFTVHFDFPKVNPQYLIETKLILYTTYLFQVPPSQNFSVLGARCIA